MSAVKLYDGATGRPLEGDQDERDQAVVAQCEADIALVLDPEAGAASLQVATDDDRRLVARVGMDEDDGFPEIYRAVQGAVRGTDRHIAKPTEVPEHLNLFHYLAAPDPNPPGPGRRDDLIETDDPLEIAAPTAPDAVGVLAYFRRESPEKSLAVHAPATGRPPDDADVTVNVDDNVETVTCVNRGRWFTDAEETEGTQQEPAAASEEAGADGDGGVASGQSTQPAFEPPDEAGWGTTALPEEESDGGGEGATENEGAARAVQAGDQEPADEGDDADAAAPEDAHGAARDEADAGERSEDDEAESAADVVDDEGPDEETAHERQLLKRLTALRQDLAAIADGVDEVTGTIEARQRVFATALSGHALADLGLTSVPVEEDRLAERRRQVRYLTLYAVLLAGVVAGWLTVGDDALASLLASEYVLDPATIGMSTAVEPVALSGMVALGGSLAVTVIATLWVLGEWVDLRATPGQLLGDLRRQLTLPGSGTVPPSVRTKTEKAQSGIEETATLYDELADDDDPRYGTFLAEELLSSPELPDVALAQREEHRRQAAVSVLSGATVGLTVGGVLLGGLWIAVGLATESPSLLLGALVSIAIAAVVAAVVRTLVVLWRVVRAPFAVLRRLPLVGGGTSGSPRRSSGAGGSTVGPATDTRDRNYDRPEGRGAEGGGSSVTTLAPAYDQGGDLTPAVRGDSGRSWRLLLSSLGLLVIVALDIAILRGPLTIPEAVPRTLAIIVMGLLPAVLAMLAAFYWALDA